MNIQNEKEMNFTIVIDEGKAKVDFENTMPKDKGEVFEVTLRGEINKDNRMPLMDAIASCVENAKSKEDVEKNISDTLDKNAFGNIKVEVNTQKEKETNLTVVLGTDGKAQVFDNEKDKEKLDLLKPLLSKDNSLEITLRGNIDEPKLEKIKAGIKEDIEKTTIHNDKDKETVLKPVVEKNLKDVGIQQNVKVDVNSGNNLEKNREQKNNEPIPNKDNSKEKTMDVAKLTPDGKEKAAEPNKGETRDKSNGPEGPKNEEKKATKQEAKGMGLEASEGSSLGELKQSIATAKIENEKKGQMDRNNDMTAEEKLGQSKIVQSMAANVSGKIASAANQLTNQNKEGTQPGPTVMRHIPNKVAILPKDTKFELDKIKRDHSIQKHPEPQKQKQKNNDRTMGR